MHNASKINVTSVARLLRAQRPSSGGRLQTLSSSTSIEHTQTIPPLPGNEVSFFGPKDHRVPLPGNVGIPASEFRPGFSYREPLDKSSRYMTELDLYKVDVTEDRQRKVYSRLLDGTFESGEFSDVEGIFHSGPELDCRVQECPLLVKKDFQELFPDHDILMKPLTIITVAHNIQHENVLRSRSMGSERERLTESFIFKAQKVVRQLSEAGFWADFINPNSGKPYLSGRFGDAVLFETDERYRHLGFTIEDLGCCKVITHHEWGRNAFVGCLFTNAPMNSVEIQKILNSSNRRK
ncbi:methylmalonic aciduria and homocystinuria type D homolog, mitochondrial [Galendromus occidentalis]|uniref:Methylmalonic aciduria and homocystinuria type D homolog, mitochondrial n=1 Tax=Galendromus occidentalis TaxID=34638 RepID=A0AAJ6QYG1_9ACAR|nr:methylmalonic aciduria and homocystinuria type D homolog, mitochondrial [Galendromus occidentalis]XP_018496753.1 methylmalonic aciduria and homocystinuria type D homolog, mitochondrial [Galendromus occidentalis]